MDHLRVATFDVISGTVEELAEVIQQPGSFVDIFHALPGFKSYSLLEVSPTQVMSISVWETHEEAEEAIAASAEWVATHMADTVKRISNTSAAEILVINARD
jgi:heme-degrading monooxygenase HmoA